MNQSSFEVLSLDNVLMNENYKIFNQKYKIFCALKTTVNEHIILIWMSLAMKLLLKKIYFEFPHALNFSAIE